MFYIRKLASVLGVRAPVRTPGLRSRQLPAGFQRLEDVRILIEDLLTLSSPDSSFFVVF